MAWTWSWTQWCSWYGGAPEVERSLPTCRRGPQDTTPPARRPPRGRPRPPRGAPAVRGPRSGSGGRARPSGLASPLRVESLGITTGIPIFKQGGEGGSRNCSAWASAEDIHPEASHTQASTSIQAITILNIEQARTDGGRVVVVVSAPAPVCTLSRPTRLHAGSQCRCTPAGGRQASWDGGPLSVGRRS